ncbi:MAG TPA: PilZ domain-containing protein [Bryobacterales bacterium]|nr:PilZ domain-containing protein [Bryobacterales bacterium]
MKPEKDRRKNPRDMCSDFVQIAWQDDRQARISYVGLLEDVSPTGLCVNLELPAPVGRTVHLHTKGFEGDAEVRYCELGDYGYLVGLEFAEGQCWEREAWKPKHLVGPLGCGG